MQERCPLRGLQSRLEPTSYAQPPTSVGGSRRSAAVLMRAIGGACNSRRRGHSRAGNVLSGDCLPKAVCRWPFTLAKWYSMRYNPCETRPDDDDVPARPLFHSGLAPCFGLVFTRPGDGL